MDSKIGTCKSLLIGSNWGCWSTQEEESEKAKYTCLLIPALREKEEGEGTVRQKKNGGVEF